MTRIRAGAPGTSSRSASYPQNSTRVFLIAHRLSAPASLSQTSINETLILDSARAVKAAGLLDLGYEYINLDDGWQAGARDPVTQAPLADPVRFPSGFKYLTDELHAMGFKGAAARGL